ncbi:MAG: alpha/beta fold hydrolase [Gemmatimonadaceae bacterium]
MRSIHVIIAATALLAGCAPRNVMSDTPAAREGYVATPDSLRLYYRVVGSGPDTIVALHGGPGVDLESIAGDLAPLAARHTVIYYDQRGAGRSDLPADTARLGARQQVEDLEAVRRHFGLGRMALVAHSYGPLLAASYAIAHPDRVRAMVFFGPVPPRRGDFFARFIANMSTRLDSAAQRRMADALRRLADSAAGPADIRRACRDYWTLALAPRLFEGAGGVSRIRSDLCASDPRGIRYGLLTTNPVVFASYGDWDLRPALRELRVPTLVVHGEADAIPMELVEEWGSAIPGARVLRVPRAAHFPHAERPELVWPEVERFLSEGR